MNATTCEQDCGRDDLLSSRVRWLVWGAPALLFAIGIGWQDARALLWIPSLTVAGAACFANAARCGRLHCKLTGPVFSLAALATLLDAVGVSSVDWRMTLAAVVLALGVGYGLEWARGKYTRLTVIGAGDRS
jgi:hypothetical protein